MCRMKVMLDVSFIMSLFLINKKYNILHCLMGKKTQQQNKTFVIVLWMFQTVYLE